jgi:hypothetical protein
MFIRKTKFKWQSRSLPAIWQMDPVHQVGGKSGDTILISQYHLPACLYASPLYHLIIILVQSQEEFNPGVTEKRDA